MTRIVFLGTPESAVPALKMVADTFDVGLVVTQPDKPKGRSATPMPPPVKIKAGELGIPVVQPTKSSDIAGEITRHGDFDLGIVVAYGRILRPEVLDLPRMGLLNVHFSLLPRWRGAAPVARALMAGDPMTGVTIIRIDEGLDTGDVLTAQAIDIHPSENAGELTTRLATLGARLLVDAIPAYLTGELAPVRQTDEGLEYAQKIKAEDRVLDVGSNPHEFVNHVRALAPNPGATLDIDGKRFKVLKAAEAPFGPEHGWEAIGGVPVVAVSGGAVALLEIQPPGKKAMAGSAWLLGARKERGRVG